MIITQCSSPDSLVEDAVAAGVIAAKQGEGHEACPFRTDVDFYLQCAWLLGWKQQKKLT